MLTTENQAYASLLCSHLRGFAHRLRQLGPEMWDWTPSPAAPTARILAVHTWQWLICDRQHIEEPDALHHPLVQEPPAETAALCDALELETSHWDKLISELTPEQFAGMRSQFNGYPMNTRDFVCHMIQNCIYKHGQFSTLYFAMGLDGDAPYDAPFPNPIYLDLREGHHDTT